MTVDEALKIALYGGPAVDQAGALLALADEVERLRPMEKRARRWLLPDRAANRATMYGRGCLDTAREILGEG